VEKKIHLIMPMGGRGSRFSKEGFDYPKPLIRIYDRPFFYWSTRSIEKFVKLVSLDFVVLQEHVEKYSIDEEIIRYFPEAPMPDGRSYGHLLLLVKYTNWKRFLLYYHTKRWNLQEGM